MPPAPNLTLPDDADDLMAFAKKTRTDLVNFRHASDAVVAQKPDTKQFVHMKHDQLREAVGGKRKVVVNLTAVPTDPGDTTPAATPAPAPASTTPPAPAKASK